MVSASADGALMQAVFDAAAVGLCCSTPQGVVLRANRALADILGVPASQLEGQALAALAPPDTADATQPAFEKPWTDASGHTRWLRVTRTALPRPAAGGEAIVCVVQDITAQRLAQARLNEAERRWRASIEDSPLLALMRDRDGCVTYCNRRFTEVSGWSCDEIVGTPYIERCVPVEERGAALAIYARRMAGVSTTIRSLWPLLCRDGRIRMVRWHSTLLRDANDAVVGLAIFGDDVTELRDAQLRLEASHRMLNETQALAHLGSWTWDIDTGVVEWSDEQFRLFGVEPGAIQPSFEFFEACLHPDDRPQVLQTIEATFQQGLPGEYEFRVLLPDGNVRWLAAKGSGERDAQGRVRRAWGYNLDVTERRQAQLALARAREQEVHLAQLGLAVERSSTEIYMVDAESGQTVFVNDAATRHLGYGREELLRLRPWDVQVGVDEAGLRALFERIVQAGGASIEFEAEFRRRDGSVYPVAMRAQASFEGGRTMLIGLADDITERREAERALRASEQRYRDIVELAQEGVWAIDVEGRTTFANRRMAEMLGTTPEAMLGRSHLEFLHAEGRLAAARDRERRAAGIAEQLRLRLLRQDGSSVWTLMSTNPLYDGQGRLAGALAMVADITDLHRSQEELRESETMFRTLFERAPLGICSATSDGRLVRLNQRMADILGGTVESLKGVSFKAFTHAEDIQQEIPLLQALIDGRSDHYAMQKRYLHASGRIVWVNVTVSMVRDTQGEPDYLIGTIEDISPRLQAERQRAASEQRLRDMLEHTRLLAVAFDTQGRVTFVNDALLALTGWQRADVAGQSWHTRFAPADEVDERVRRFQAWVAGDQGPRTAKQSLRLRDDSTRLISWDIVPLRDASGALEGLAALGVDITDAEAARQRDAELVRLGVLVENTSDLIAISDLKTRRFIFANAALARATGYSREELMALDAERLDTGMTRETARVIVGRQRRGEVGPVTRESTVTRRDGSSFPIELKLTHHRDGEREFWLGIASDISARRTAEALLRASLREKETLLREIHHRVKNNLQIISSLLYFQSRKEGATQQARVLDEARSRLQSMIVVHEKLYQSDNLSSIDVGDYVTTLARQIQDSYAHLADRVTLEVRAQPLLLPVEVTLPAGMMLAELLTNAFKYAFPAPRSGTIRVTLTADAAAGRMQLVVADDGVGLPAGDGAASGSSHASFGLQLLKGLAVQLDAQFVLQSEHGTRACIEIPIAAAHAALPITA